MLLRARVPPRLLYRAVTRLRPSSYALRKYSESSGPAQAQPNHVGQAVAPAPNSYRGHCAPFPARTHTCAQLSAEHAGSRVVLTGWLLPPRKVGKGFFFFPLRDPYGTLQLVVQSDADSDMLALMRDIPAESTVLVEGTVHERPASQKRPHQGGDIEVAVTSFTLLNPADRNLPFSPSDTRNLPAEEYRLRYRYLDLRRPALSSNLQKRSQVAHLIRTTLHDHDFVEVETPILLKSTPEGAREFLVPTRVTASSSSSSTPPPANGLPTTGTTEPLFYALPQSPQQPKQLLIASGAVDRYYQIARCFRDEDGRKDRQPEFTQVDLEMAWVSWGEPPSDPPSHPNSNTLSNSSSPSNSNTIATTENTHTDRETPGESDGWRIGGREVRTIVERMIRKIWSRVQGVELPGKEGVAFEVLTYKEAMGRFGSDKPDVRFGLQLQDVTARLPAADRSVLSNSDEIVEGLVVHACDKEFARAAGQKALLKAAGSDGVHTIRRIKGQTVATRSTDDILANTDPEAIAEALDLQDGDVAFLARRTRIPEGGSTRLGRLRLLLANTARTLGDFTYPPDDWRFLWVTEFPLFTRADEDKEFLAHGRWSSSHHPFTAPMWEDIGKMYDGRIDEVRGQHYDLVLNGTEIGGGSVRVHDADMQEYIFKNVLQLDETERASFDHLLHALRCGAPPHGGIALGFDRLMAILCNAESIRDVIAFPKTGAGTDLLFKSPASSTDETLKIYNLQARQNQ